jgi:ABC-type phosphate transport system permease subunit
MQANAGTMTMGTAAAHAPATDQAKATAPGATASVVCGILGFFIFGFILGPVAIGKANAARKQIAAHPDRYTGEGLATAGTVLGVIDIIGAVFAIMMMAAG